MILLGDMGAKRPLHLELAPILDKVWWISGKLAKALQVKVSVHGHHHDSLDSSRHWSTQGFKSYGVGLRGITAVDKDGPATVLMPRQAENERA